VRAKAIQDIPVFLAAQDIEFKGDLPYTGCKNKDNINSEH
jgi:hypothetical protein